MATDDVVRCTIIVINYAPESTGIAPYTSGLAAGLAARGHRVRVLTGLPHYPQWQVHDDFNRKVRRQRLDGVDVHRIPHYVPARPVTWRRALMELIFGIRATLSGWGRPEVVITISPALFATALITLRARLTGVPVICWVQDIYTLGIEQTGPGRFAGLLKSVESRVLRQSNRVVAIHDRFKRVLTERLGARADIVDVIRNWSHVSPPEVGGDPAVRAVRGWSEDEIIVLHAGNMGAKQGLENVIEAADLAAKRGSRVRFVLLGDGNQRARLQQRAGAGHPNLQFVEPLPDGLFAETLAAADVLLVNERPGVIDMCVPSKLTSYFATGLPVLGAVDPAGITAEELVAAGAGPCVDAGDPEALLAAAVQLAGDDGAQARYGANARAFCRDRLSEAAALDAFEQSITATRAPARRHSGRTVIPENSTPGTPVDSLHNRK